MNIMTEGRRSVVFMWILITTTFGFLLDLLVLKISCQVVINDDCQYENVVVNIDSSVRSDLNLERIEYHFEAFSKWMREKTDGRHIGTLIVVLPEDKENFNFTSKGNVTWDKEDEVRPLTDETLATSAAFLVVGNKFGVRRYPRPYTVHLGECGTQGEHIIVTDQLIQSLDISHKHVGMLLLHEWAHYRWGIFDEYGADEDIPSVSPFYQNEQKNISVTGCPSQLRGWLLKQKQGNYSRCSLTEEDLPERSCKFYVSENRSDEASIMMGFGDGQKESFCGKEKVIHNENAPNIHNQKCNYKSSWEVMKNHPDFSKKCSGQSEDSGDFTVVYKRRSREKIRSNIRILVDEVGLSNIYDKVANAVICLRELGRMNEFDIDWTTDFGKINKNSKYFVIMDSWNDSRINKWSKGRDENVIYVLNKLNDDIPKKRSIRGLSLATPASELVPSLCNLVLKTLIPKEKIPLLVHKKTFKGKTSGKFFIGADCEKALFIALSHDKRQFEENILKGPNEKVTKNCIHAPVGKDSNPLILTQIYCNESLIEGDWTYSFPKKQIEGPLIVFVFCLPKKDAKRPLSILPKVSEQKEERKTAMAVLVSQNDHPVVGANVTAIITSEDESETVRQLRDDGIGSDLRKNDGIYSGEHFDYGGNGVFSFSFAVETNGSTKSIIYIDETKNTFFGENYPAMTSGHGIPLGNYFVLNEKNEEQIKRDFGPPRNEFSLDYFLEDDIEQPDIRIVNEEVPLTNQHVGFTQVQVTNYIPGDFFAPGKVTDLKVVKISSTLATVTMEWTSAGDDGFDGQATSILLKYSEYRSFYPSRFNTEGTEIVESDLRDGTSLRPKVGRQKHRVVISMQKRSGSLYLEDAIFFFALVTRDEVDNLSHVSNLAHAYFKPGMYNDEMQKHKKASTSALLVLSVIGGFAGAIFLSCGIIYFYVKCKKTRGGETGDETLKTTESFGDL